jgi:hypothetical protein
MEKKHFGTSFGYGAHSARVSSERDIRFSGISYGQHILQGSWGWIGNRLGDKCDSLFTQKENGKVLSNEERAAFTLQSEGNGFSATGAMNRGILKVNIFE